MKTRSKLALVLSVICVSISGCSTPAAREQVNVNAPNVKVSLRALESPSNSLPLLELSILNHSRVPIKMPEVGGITWGRFRIRSSKGEAYAVHKEQHRQLGLTFVRPLTELKQGERLRFKLDLPNDFVDSSILGTSQNWKRLLKNVRWADVDCRIILYFEGELVENRIECTSNTIRIPF